MQMWLDEHLRNALDNFKIGSFQSADALWELLSTLDIRLGKDSWIEDHSHIFGISFYRDIFKYIQFLLPHLPFHACFIFQPVRLAAWEPHQIYHGPNTGDRWCDTPIQLHARLTILPVICASNQSNWTDLSANQNCWGWITWLLLFDNLSSGNQSSVFGFFLR